MTPFPFTALVAQEQLQLGLLLNAIDPGIGGVLVRGQKGTAKSTAVRALASLLPEVVVVAGCPYACDPTDPDPRCPARPHPDGASTRPARLVELPVGATEDRVAGSLDLERALTEGARAFDPGLLARAHRGVLYVDEVNLLNDHLVDLLLDAAAMGRNHVEREGVSIEHAARFLLVGTMNPEEGELRPQLLDRFGLTVEVAAPRDATARAEVVRRRLAYEADPAGFAARFADAEHDMARRIVAARDLLAGVTLTDRLLTRIVEVCAAFEVDGMRADIVIARAAKAAAAWRAHDEVSLDDVRTACLLALPHRRRRGPFEEPGLDPDELDRFLDRDDDPDPDPDDPGGRDHDPGVDDEDGAPGDTTTEQPPGAHAPGDHEPAPSGGRARLEASAGEPGAPDTSPDQDTTGGSADDGDGDAGPGPAPAQVHGIGEAGPPPLLTVPGVGAGAWGRRSQSRSRHGATVGARRSRSDEHGTLGGLAVGATLRAAAPYQLARGRSAAGLVLRREDLHQRIRQGREGNLIVFVVDASGSMGARTRMVAVKGAVRALLLDAYQRRDKVALITVRGEGAQLALPPTASTEVADRRLADIPTGGRTPIGAGLEQAATLLAVEGTRDPDRRPLVVVLTDGRANVGPDAVAASHRAGRALTARGIASVVIDTEDGFVRMGLAPRLATAMTAPCLTLDDLAAAPLAGAVRRLTPRRAA